MPIKNMKGKTAFITGGASGIGLGIAKACAKEGMNIVIADLRQNAIDEALEIFKANNWPAIGVQLDVSDREAYVVAADKAEAAFGKIHLLVNNAGIGCAMGNLWEVSYDDIDMAIRVNLRGAINGVRTILPRILAHGEEGHVVSTCSQAALLPNPGFALYNITKMGVMAAMESLSEDLYAMGSPVGASAFCPGGYITNLGVSSDEVVATLRGKKVEGEKLAAEDVTEPTRSFDGWLEVMRSPDDAGARVVRGVQRGDLFILTHIEFKEGVEKRFEAIRKCYPQDVPNHKYNEIFDFLTYNAVYDTQTQVPAMPKD